MMLETLLHLQELDLDQFGVYQIKSDSPSCHVSPKVLTGRFIDLEETLCQYNREGAGIFIQVNGGTGRGQDKIKKVFWLFADFDKRRKLPGLPLKPHMVVRTKRGFHVYWKIRPTKDIVLWNRVQEELCHRTGADPNAIQVAQVLRLVGFDHCKKGRYRIDFHDWDLNLPSYNIKELAYTFELLGDLDGPSQKFNSAIPTKPLTKLELNMLFPIAKFELGRQREKIRRAKPGQRRASVRDASYCLGHYVHWGLDRSKVYDLILTEVRNVGWTDHDLSPKALKATMERNILKGMKEGQPYMKPELEATAEQFKAGERVLKVAKEVCKSWPNVMTTDKAKALLGHELLQGAWTSKKQASHQLGIFLQSQGYRKSSRSNGRTKYVRSSEGDSYSW